MEKTLTLPREWDKPFPRSEQVEHSKATAHNRCGISLILALLLGLPACGTPSPAGTAQSPEPLDTAPPRQTAAPASPDAEEGTGMVRITLTFNGHTYTAALADNPSAEAFAELLADGPLTVSAHDYGGFEKVAPLGVELPRTDEQITTAPGDIILYQGNQITVYYAPNTWSFTRLGRIDDPSGLREALGGGDVDITFRLRIDPPAPRPSGSRPSFQCRPR